MASVTICSDVGAQKNKVWHCFHWDTSIYFEFSPNRCCNFYLATRWQHVTQGNNLNVTLLIDNLFSIFCLKNCKTPNKNKPWFRVPLCLCSLLLAEKALWVHCPQPALPPSCPLYTPSLCQSGQSVYVSCICSWNISTRAEILLTKLVQFSSSRIYLHHPYPRTFHPYPEKYQLSQQWSRCPWIIWRRKWQPTPVFLPGKSHGRRSLVGYSPWGHKESDTTERLHFHPWIKARWSVGYTLYFLWLCIF